MTSPSPSRKSHYHCPSSPQYYHSPSPPPPLRHSHSHSLSNSPLRHSPSPSPSPSPSHSHSPSPSPQRHYRRRHRSTSFSTERSRDRIPLRHRSRETHLRRSRSRDRNSRHRHEYHLIPSRYMRNCPPRHSHSHSWKRDRHYHRRPRSTSSSTERSRDRIPLAHRSRETHLRRSRRSDRHSRYRHEYHLIPSRYIRNCPPRHSHSHSWKRHRHYRRRPRSTSSSTERSQDRIPLRHRSRETHLRRRRSRDRHSRHRHEYTTRPSRDYHSKHRSSLSHSRPPKRHRHYHSRLRSTSSSTERSRDRIPIRHSFGKSHLRRGKSRDRDSRHSHEYRSRPSRYMRNYPLERRNESPIVRSSPLLLYKHFINGLDVNILPDEAYRRFKPYLHQLKKGFFAAYKDDHRLRDMYHPSHIETAINKRNEYANEVARNFFKDLQNGTLMLLTLNPLGNAAKHLKDLNQARCLIAKVDAEKGIQQNVLLSSQQDGVFAQFVAVKNSDQSIITLGGIELLNVVIAYLWDVHAIDYYGMAELGKDLITREEKNLAAAEIEQRLESVWQGRLQARDPLHVSLGKDRVECLVNRNLCAHLTIVEEEKEDGHIKIRYVCKENSCGKCCKAFGDIITHIHDEHSGVVEGYSAQAREEIYLENYMNDPSAPCTVN